MCGAVNVRSLFSYLGSFSSSSQAPSFLIFFPCSAFPLKRRTFTSSFLSPPVLSRQIVKHSIKFVGYTVPESGFSGVGNPVEVGRELNPPDPIKRLTTDHS